MDFRRMRKQMRTLGSVIGYREDRISYSNLAQIAEDLFPSPSVPIGGALFQVYLEGFTRPSVYNRFGKALQEMEEKKHTHIAEAINRSLMESEIQHYTGLLLYWINRVTVKGLKQQFFITFTSRYYGLSRMGIKCMGALGYLSTMSYFDDKLKNVISKCKAAVSQLDNVPHVRWFDNFSKIWSKKVPNLEQGIYSDCLWTGVAIIRWVDSYDDDVDITELPDPPDLSVQIDSSDGSVVSCMPGTIVDEDGNECIIEALDVLNANGEGRFRQNRSICLKYDVRNLPLKPVVDEELYPELYNILKCSVDGLDNFYPVGLIQLNIGKNEHLLKILRNYLEELKAARPRRYGVMLCDVAIFQTVVRIMYDPTGAASELKRYVIPSLGWWHSYKMASYAIYLKYSNTFFAGCFHALWPAKAFYPHPKYLSTVIMHLSLVRLAYPGFKTELDNALSSDDTGLSSKMHLLNLQSLCEFFIPVIQDYGCVLKMNDAGLAMNYQYLMLKVMILLEHNQYSRNIYLNLQILQFNKVHNTAYWRMFEQNPACLNEEPGETSFSVLSRCTVGDTSKSKFDHLSTMYAALPLYRQIAEDTRHDIGAPLIKPGHSKIREDALEVKAVEAFFLQKIRELKSNTFRIYRGTERSYSCQIQAHKNMKAGGIPEEIYQDDVTGNVEGIRKFYEKNYKNHWLTDYQLEWPEAVTVNNDNSEDDSTIAGNSENEVFEDESLSIGDDEPEIDFSDSHEDVDSVRIRESDNGSQTEDGVEHVAESDLDELEAQYGDENDIHEDEIDSLYGDGHSQEYGTMEGKIDFAGDINWRDTDNRVAVEMKEERFGEPDVIVTSSETRGFKNYEQQYMRDVYKVSRRKRMRRAVVLDQAHYNPFVYE